MKPTTSNRFALAGSTGRLVALVADGLPAWPVPEDAAEPTLEHFAGFEDAALGTLEAELLATFEQLAGSTTPGEADEQEMATIAERVNVLRAVAAARYAAAAAPEPTPTPEPEPTADPEREARIAALRAGMTDPPAPTAEPLEGELLLAAEPLDIEALVNGVATATATAVATALLERPTDAQGRPVSAADLAAFQQQPIVPAVVTSQPRIPGRLLTSADISGVPMGQEIRDMGTLVQAMISRHGTLGRSSGVDDEAIPVATLAVDVPPERDLRETSWSEARSKVAALCGPDAVGIDPWTGKEALVAAGGLAAMVQPYYGQLVIAQSARPVRDALPTFAADRGGIRLVLPPSLATLLAATTPGTYTDAVVTNADATVTSATAAFNVGDVGKPISGPGIPAGTLILSVTNATTIEMTVNATATTNPATIYLSGRNPNNLGSPVALQTLAQDEANGIKLTYDVPKGTQAEFDVYAVYTSLQFGNIGARTYPEAVEANIRLADALHARVAETQMLDVITAWSTLMTGAKTFGTARQLLAQLGHMAAWYRNSERMDPKAVLRVGLPAWSANAMSADWLSTFVGSDLASAAGLSDDEIASILREHRLVPFFYQDGPSDISQLFSTTGVTAATNTGTNSATPIAIPDYPGTGATTSFRTKIVSFMWAEGTWLGLTTGELNLGLVRDSILNAQNRFRNFQEEWETPAFVGTRSLRCVHTVAADGSYGAAASVTLGVGSGL